MNTGPDIGFGGGAAQAAPYTVNTTTTTAPTSVNPATDTPATATTATGASVPAPSTDTVNLNPRTVLDPDLYVNVARFQYSNDIAFQVPSKDRVEAYQEAQDARTTQDVVTVPREVVDTTIATGEITHNAGDGAGETQATATVTATAVGQNTPATETGAVRREDNSNPSGRPTTTPTTHKVDLEG